MAKEYRKIEKLFKKLCKQRLYDFRIIGYTESKGVPNKQGVYIVFSPNNLVLHVGRTQRGKNGLRQHLNNHLLGQSSFVKRYLNGRGRRLRRGYKFKYLVIKNPRERALVEALAIGRLCPKYVGLGTDRKKSKN